MKDVLEEIKTVLEIITLAVALITLRKKDIDLKTIYQEYLFQCKNK
ncbi:hypothetical protein [Listeria monocytogenes]|nr:hypothetical protein [Listeria monocytogenes]